MLEKAFIHFIKIPNRTAMGALADHEGKPRSSEQKHINCLWI